MKIVLVRCSRHFIFITKRVFSLKQSFTILQKSSLLSFWLIDIYTEGSQYCLQGDGMTRLYVRRLRVPAVENTFQIKKASSVCYGFEIIVSSVVLIKITLPY